MTHTPGPWVVKNYWFVKAPNGLTVATVSAPKSRGKEYHEDVPYALGNAHLIAASPEMLERLERLADALSVASNAIAAAGHLSVAQELGREDVLTRALIAKARGNPA